MELTLRDHEVALLAQILAEYLSDLRMEIVDTEKYEWREAMKQQEATIKSLIDRLQSAQVAA